MNGVEGSDDQTRRIDIAAEKNAHEVAAIGVQMDTHITKALRKNGIDETFLYANVHREDNSPTDSLPSGVTITSADRLPWLRRAVRDYVTRVCDEAKVTAPEFEGTVPPGEIPSEFEYVGDLIGAVAEVSSGKARGPFLVTPLQIGPDAQIDQRGKDVDILLDAKKPAPGDFPLGAIMTPSIVVNKPTAFGVTLEVATKPMERSVSYSIVRDQPKA